MVLFFPCSCRRYLTVLRRGLSTDCKGSVDGTAALYKGQRVQEIGDLVGVLASKANCMMPLDRRGLVRLPVVNCPASTIRPNIVANEVHDRGSATLDSR
jgi:hypothetical protein